MDTASLAQSALLPKATRERVMRGVALFRERGEEITPKPNGGLSVPGSNGRSYRVSLAGDGRCGCLDYLKRRRPCKHVYAATIYRAKSRGGVA